MPTAPTLTETRARTLEAFTASHRPGEELDVLVVGGGATGAGTALDAATRGLRVAIVESHDWGEGTSSRSSKLVHGGLRYLQMLDFRLVHEALTERDRLLLTVAPHLVRPARFLYPLRHRVWERAYVGAGVLLYDVLATLSPRRRALPFHRHLSRRRLARMFPDLRQEAAVGAVQYWDAKVDDARLVLTLVRTAVQHGALAASRTELVRLSPPAGDGLSTAELRDVETGTRIEVRAKQVIVASGAWTEDTQTLAGAESGLRVLASKGVHIVVPRDRIQGDAGLIVQTERSVLFVIPWTDHWLIGTTDTPWDGSLRTPTVEAADVDYLLDQANRILATPLRREDVTGAYVGLRPLVQPSKAPGTSSAKISREHTVAAPRPGLTVVAGGKLTTYRVMAKDAVDFALRDTPDTPPSITDRIPLLGADGLAALQNRAPTLAARHGWDQQRVDRLLSRYGSLLPELVRLIEQDPALGRPLAHAEAYLGAEVAYAVLHEGALHLEDVMRHRTRLSHEQPDGGMAAAREIATIMAARLGWDEAQIDAEIARYAQRLADERQAGPLTPPSPVPSPAATSAGPRGHSPASPSSRHTRKD